jgi:uncharacterized membrane protein
VGSMLIATGTLFVVWRYVTPLIYRKCFGERNNC